MKHREYQVGDLVVLIGGEWQGHAGIVSWPISREAAGYVLVYSGEWVAGLRASHDEVIPAGESAEGFTQLANQLIKLSSHLIEKAVLPLTAPPLHRKFNSF